MKGGGVSDPEMMGGDRSVFPLVLALQGEGVALGFLISMGIVAGVICFVLLIALVIWLLAQS
jgi:hypothetical protein